MQKDEKVLKDLLKQFSSQENLKQKLAQIKVEEAWNVRFKDLKPYTRKIKIEGDQLVVTLGSGPLVQELSYNKDKIINELNSILGEPMIKSLTLR